jgi:uncharacterized 2Fe-2S/4Fe-4S cluster protein (DUF4445 family)
VSWTIDFEPVGRRVHLDAGKTLLEATEQIVSLGEDALYAPCGGQGLCGRCRIRIVKGPVSPPTDVEQRSLKEEALKAGVRLACQVRPLGPLHVEIPPESLAGRQKLQVEGTPVAVVPAPAIKRYSVELKASSLRNPLSVWQQTERFLSERYHLHDIRPDLELVRRVPALAEQITAMVTLRGSEIINAHVTGQAPKPVGLAVDLGTTKVAGFLVELESGVTLAAEGIMNPQIPYGEDVMSRLAYALGDEKHLAHLAQMAGEGINRLLRTLLARAGLESNHVEEALLVGNTAMHHLLLRLPVQQLARAPYLPAVSGPIEVKAREIGLQTAPGTVAYFLSPVASFVGGDHVAMILASRLHETSGTVLGLDIGTNTEVVLARAGNMICCSCPSGPAFEGAHIYQGMRAVDGAISRFQLTDGGRAVHYETIGGRPPVGLCGSGVLDVVAQLLQHGIISDYGILDRNHPRVRKGGEGEGFHFLLVPAAISGQDHDLILTQKDISEIQLVKSAIASGIELLLRFTGIRKDEIEKVVVAGAFGTHLRLESAVAIGLLPDLPLERFEQVGNAAGTGARVALVSLIERSQAAKIAQRAQYLELTTRPEFQDTFTRALRFPRISS